MHGRTIAAWLLALLAVLAVGSMHVPPPPVAAAAEPASVWLDARRSTRGDIAVRNLGASIAALRGRPRTPANQLALVEALLLRVGQLGAFDDLEEVDALTRSLADTGAPDGLLSRVGFLSLVHRFAEAQAVLAHAASAGGAPARVERAAVSIELAIGGDPADLEERARVLAADAPTFSHRALLASVLAAEGNFVEADDAYRAALEAYRDVSPFILAWVSFQRGVMWAEAAGRPDLARPLYEDAVRRLPAYVVAQVHLAEIEAEAGDRDAAIARLFSVVAAADPEPRAVLSGLLSGDAARTHREAAARGYESLLRAHREAFLDHAAEFYVGVGRPALALALARENLALRSVARAHLLFLRTSAIASPSAVCAARDGSMPFWSAHPVLEAEARALGAGCAPLPAP